MGNEEIIIDEEGFQNLENKLEELFREIKATATLLVDKNGFLILAKGRFPDQTPEDMGVMASAAFTALNQMMNHKSDQITVNFQLPRDEIVRCHIFHRKMFLILLFKPHMHDEPEREERIRNAAQSFMKEIDRIFFP
jgi:hypothetical protein